MKKLMCVLRSVGLVGFLLAIPGAATSSGLGGLNGFWDHMFAMSGMPRPGGGSIYGYDVPWAKRHWDPYHYPNWTAHAASRGPLLGGSVFNPSAGNSHQQFINIFSVYRRFTGYP